MLKIKHLITALLIFFLTFSIAHATKITIVNNDSAGEGFNDTTPVAPVTGNPGTTLGQQRLNVFLAVADYWETRLQSTVEIKVASAMNPLPCNSMGATLGQAGPNNVFRDNPSPSFPESATWYVQALANSLTGISLMPDPDINATFNSDIDNNNACLNNTNWSYVIGASSPGSINFYDVVVHEIAHGLGFISLVSSAGEKFGGFNDNYMSFLKDESTNKNWSAMSNAERFSSARNTHNVVWTGSLAITESSSLASGLNNGKPQIYTPDPFQTGSSVSHWDTALSPDEVMEPYATNLNSDGLSIQAFYDMHWIDPCRITMSLAQNSWKQFGIPCEPPSNADTVADILGDDITGSYGTNWKVFSFNPNTNGYDPLTPNDQLEVGKGYWIISISNSATLDMPLKSKKVSLTSSTYCASTNDCFETPLTASSTLQWQMLASPFRDNFNWSDLRIKIDTGATTCNDSNGCTMAQAQTDGLVEDQAWTYDAATNSYVLLKNTTISPWTGMWIATLAGSANTNPPKLFFPSE
ncbi:MAG: hypothetical protein KAH20_11390 [Methylococcales bacterium]|nr:hypothetical protein [Methylococcales bacterium]